MLLGGVQKFSAIDYPGKLSAIVFTIGCNFRCPFCHNPELVLPEQIKDQPIFSEKEFFNFLKERKGLLDGVCITGGEPTVQSDLSNFIQKIKNLGYLVKLDSNGSNPKVLRDLLEKKIVDYLAMDIKSPLEKYSLATGVEINLDDIKESIELVKQFPKYEFRTTVVPDLIQKEDIEAIGHWLKGSSLYTLQQYHQDKTIDPEYEKKEPYSDEIIKSFAQVAKPFFKKVEVKGIME